MADGPQLALLVLDTGPLITLAAADSLDYLLLPGLPVSIPDAVFYEATQDSARLGAQAILEWVQARGEAVRVLPTEAFANFLALLALRPGHRERDLGERAALEALRDVMPLAAVGRALLVTEDDRVLRQGGWHADEPGAPVMLTTRDFLLACEDERRINSTDEVYRRAEDAGRLASRRQAAQRSHEEAMAALRAVPRRP